MRWRMGRVVSRLRVTAVYTSSETRQNIWAPRLPYWLPHMPGGWSSPAHRLGTLVVRML